MTDVSHHLRFLGFKCRDKITGFEGVGSSVCFDLYGCIQTSLTPPHKEGAEKFNAGHWFDNNRLEIVPDTVRIMEPQFRLTPPAEDRPGPADRPAR